MRRPNKLDWLVYRLFRWWWNPILRRDSDLLERLVVEMAKWLPRPGWQKALDTAKAEMIREGLVEYAAKIRLIEKQIPTGTLAEKAED